MRLIIGHFQSTSFVPKKSDEYYRPVSLLSRPGSMRFFSYSQIWNSSMYDYFLKCPRSNKMRCLYNSACSLRSIVTCKNFYYVCNMRTHVARALSYIPRILNHFLEEIREPDREEIVSQLSCKIFTSVRHILKRKIRFYWELWQSIQFSSNQSSGPYR